MSKYKSCAKYLDIQSDIINQYNIDLCDGEKCANDWHRTHAHVKERRVCKWKCANSIQSTFALFHEIGHIETTKSNMRRAESEYYATVWAIEKCEECGLQIPDTIINQYQKYIDTELERGKRRGGTGYEELNLSRRTKMNNNYKIGDIVYVNGPWNVAEKCEITSEQGSRKNGDGFYSVHSLDLGGSFGAFTDNIFSTKEDAIAAHKRKSDENIAKYKEEIKNLNDLLKFPLDHCFCGEEYTDYDAIQAYKTKAFELTGIVLEED